MESTYGLHTQGNYICRETWTYLFLTLITWVLAKIPQMFHNCGTFQKVGTKADFAWATIPFLPTSMHLNCITFSKLDVSSLYSPCIYQWQSRSSISFHFQLCTMHSLLLHHAPITMPFNHPSQDNVYIYMDYTMHAFHQIHVCYIPPCIF